MSDRFYVKEITGYRMHIGHNQAGNAKETTDVMVLDRAYCHRVVWSQHPRGGTGGHTLERVRAEAKSECAALNRWDRRG